MAFAQAPGGGEGRTARGARRRPGSMVRCARTEKLNFWTLQAAQPARRPGHTGGHPHAIAPTFPGRQRQHPDDAGRARAGAVRDGAHAPGHGHHASLRRRHPLDGRRRGIHGGHRRHGIAGRGIRGGGPPHHAGLCQHGGRSGAAGAGGALRHPGPVARRRGCHPGRARPAAARRGAAGGRRRRRRSRAAGRAARGRFGHGVPQRQRAGGPGGSHPRRRWQHHLARWKNPDQQRRREPRRGRLQAA